jgi:hypothetical protein
LIGFTVVYIERAWLALLQAKWVDCGRLVACR